MLSGHLSTPEIDRSQTCVPHRVFHAQGRSLFWKCTLSVLLGGKYSLEALKEAMTRFFLILLSQRCK